MRSSDRRKHAVLRSSPAACRARESPGASGIYSVKPGAVAEAVSRVNVAVAVADDARSCIYEVAAACCVLGFDHTATLTAVGVFTGSVEREKLANLWTVPGVIAVEVECEFPSQLTAAEWRRRVN